MNEKNYSCVTSIRNLFPLLLMLLFVNLSWGQTPQSLNYTMPSNFVKANMTEANGWLSSGIGSDYSSPGSNIKFDTSGDWATLRIASTPSVVKYNLKGNGLSGAYVFQLSESADGVTFAPLLTITSGIGTSNTLFQANLASSTRYIKWTYVTKVTGNIGFGGVIVEAPTNTAPTVSNVEISGLPTTGAELAGSYDYADAENDVDASTYQWYTATDASGTGATPIDGATLINYTLTNAELGKYIRFGVQAASATGTSPGVEVFSPWIGPVNAAGTPVLNAGLLSTFAATCLNQTTASGSFTLMGSNLSGNVTVGSLSGFAYSLVENGDYTPTLTITPVSESIDTVVYVRFTPTVAQSYNGTIVVSGGGAASANVSVMAEGINTAVVVTTGASSNLTASTATIAGSLMQGCSTVLAYGIEYSTTENFANGTGTVITATNIEAGAFSATLSGLNSFTTYYYKAFATDASGTVYGAQNSFTTNAVSAPTALEATGTGMNSFTAHWEAVEGVSTYELDVYEKVLGVSPNLVVNPGFEADDLSAWTFESGMNQVISTAQVADGNSSLYTTVTATKNFFQDITVASGQEYTLTIKYYIDPSSTGSGFRVWTTDGATVQLPSSSAYYNTKGSWVTVTQNFTTNASTLKLNFRLYNGVKLYMDSIEVKKTQPSITQSYLEGYQNLEVNGVSQIVSGLNPATEYFYVVRAKDANSTSTNSNEVAVTTADAVTVFEDGVWSNGVPTAALDAVILSNFTTTENLEAKSLTITSGQFTVASGTVLTVVESITNNAGANAFVVENNGIVLQTSDAVNTALATVKVNSANLYRQDYTLWSSPVSGQNLRSFSPQTLYNRFSSYDTALGTAGDYVQEIVTTADMNTKTFVNAKGYLIRMPNNWTQYVNTSIPGTPFLGEFVGTLNNGTVSIGLSQANTKLNLVGNPYPSPISITDFMTTNASNIENTLYFWRKSGSANLSNTASGYATYSSLGFTSADASINNVVPTHIHAGQGFFVVARSAGDSNLVFNNNMRGTANSTFYRSSNETSTAMHRFWLNLSNENVVVGQTLVGYMSGATEEVDSGVDALYFNDSAVALTSLINDSEYIIQGRSLPFTDTDIVPLGFKTDVAGNFTISLFNFDGLFADDQAIYLRDNTAGVVHNLKSSDYSFTTPAGIFNTRFEVLYNTTLGTNNPALTHNNILVGVKDQIIQINAGNVTMEKIELIDVSGRVIYTQDGVNATTATLEQVIANNQMLIVRIHTKESGIVTQKIIF